MSALLDSMSAGLDAIVDAGTRTVFDGDEVLFESNRQALLASSALDLIGKSVASGEGDRERAARLLRLASLDEDLVAFDAGALVARCLGGARVSAQQITAAGTYCEKLHLLRAVSAVLADIGERGGVVVGDASGEKSVMRNRESAIARTILATISRAMHAGHCESETAAVLSDILRAPLRVSHEDALARGRFVRALCTQTGLSDRHVAAALERVVLLVAAAGSGAIDTHSLSPLEDLDR